MKRKQKALLKLNILSLFLLAVSFMSITLAWFAYSGLSRASLDIGVKSWYIEFDKNGEAVSNDIIIALEDVYPGMEKVSEEVEIKNMGDSTAGVSYSIASAQILDENLDVDNIDKIKIEDDLSHEYPFHVDMSLSKNVAVSQGGQSTFVVSVSWPLDSGNDEADSLWGTKVYDFMQSEKTKAQRDNSYQMKNPVRIIISLKAEQLLDSDDSYDPKYMLGSNILYDVALNKRCQQLSDTCIRTNVIDTDNKQSDTTVNLLPSIMSNDLNPELWSTEKRLLSIEDILKIISIDVNNSYIIRNNLSDTIIGSTKYPGRVDSIISMLGETDYFKFNTETFSYLKSSNNICLSPNYMMEKQDDISSIIKIGTECENAYVITATKESLNLE